MKEDYYPFYICIVGCSLFLLALTLGSFLGEDNISGTIDVDCYDRFGHKIQGQVCDENKYLIFNMELDETDISTLHLITILLVLVSVMIIVGSFLYAWDLHNLRKERT